VYNKISSGVSHVRLRSFRPGRSPPSIVCTTITTSSTTRNKIHWSSKSVRTHIGAFPWALHRDSALGSYIIRRDGVLDCSNSFAPFPCAIKSDMPLPLNCWLIPQSSKFRAGTSFCTVFRSVNSSCTYFRYAALFKASASASLVVQINGGTQQEQEHPGLTQGTRDDIQCHQP
jgi:hypothetical protein